MSKEQFNELILIAGQWKDSPPNKLELELQFSLKLDQLEKTTKKTRESLVQQLLQFIEKGVVA